MGCFNGGFSLPWLPEGTLGNIWFFRKRLVNYPKRGFMIDEFWISTVSITYHQYCSLNLPPTKKVNHIQTSFHDIRIDQTVKTVKTCPNKKSAPFIFFHSFSCHHKIHHKIHITIGQSYPPNKWILNERSGPRLLLLPLASSQFIGGLVARGTAKPTLKSLDMGFMCV